MDEISRNITKHVGHITSEQRKLVLNQQAYTVWFTGLSGAGKSTLAYELERQLISSGKVCYVLDGDNLRHGLNSDLDFSIDARNENIRRVAEVAKLMNDAGLIVITAFISPLIENRALAKNIIGKECFKEIYVNTPLEICESRDRKGLYAKARQGQITDFTGISSPYQPPLKADLELNNTGSNLHNNICRLLEILT